MSDVHDFAERLAYSHKQAEADWWHDCYLRAFPNLLSTIEVREDGWAQRAGIDRILVLADGKIIKVDEKVREKDYGDILLEYWSNYERRVRGWICKPLDCDFIAYAIEPTKTCYLLPTLLLQRAWREVGRDWCDRAKGGVKGYRMVDAQNAGYVTKSVAVPVGDVLSGIASAITVTWG